MAEANSSGIGFWGLLGLLFIGLKLAGVIGWSWWLVLLLLYGGSRWFWPWLLLRCLGLV